MAHDPTAGAAQRCAGRTGVAHKRVHHAPLTAGNLDAEQLALFRVEVADALHTAAAALQAASQAPSAATAARAKSSFRLLALATQALAGACMECPQDADAMQLQLMQLQQQGVDVAALLCAIARFNSARSLTLHEMRTQWQRTDLGMTRPVPYNCASLAGKLRYFLSREVRGTRAGAFTLWYPADRTAKMAEDLEEDHRDAVLSNTPRRDTSDYGWQDVVLTFESVESANQIRRLVRLAPVTTGADPPAANAAPSRHFLPRHGYWKLTDVEQDHYDPGRDGMLAFLHVMRLRLSTPFALEPRAFVVQAAKQARLLQSEADPTAKLGEWAARYAVLVTQQPQAAPVGVAPTAPLPPPGLPAPVAPPAEPEDPAVAPRQEQVPGGLPFQLPAVEDVLFGAPRVLQGAEPPLHWDDTPVMRKPAVPQPAVPHTPAQHTPPSTPSPPGGRADAGAGGGDEDAGGLDATWLGTANERLRRVVSALQRLTEHDTAQGGALAVEQGTFLSTQHGVDLPITLLRGFTPPTSGVWADPEAAADGAALAASCVLGQGHDSQVVLGVQGGLGHVTRDSLVAVKVLNLQGSAGEQVAALQRLEMVHDALRDGNSAAHLNLPLSRFFSPPRHHAETGELLRDTTLRSKTGDASGFAVRPILVAPLAVGSLKGRAEAADSRTAPWRRGELEHVARELLDALMLLHEVQRPGELKLGVVHGDLHEGNVLVTREGRLVLADFGSAMAVAGTGALRSMSLSLGAGPALAALRHPPEAVVLALSAARELSQNEVDCALQVVGESTARPGHLRGVTTRSDMWQLGALLFRLAAGQELMPSWAVAAGAAGASGAAAQVAHWVRQVLAGTVAPLVEHAPLLAGVQRRDMASLIALLTDFSVARRPTALQARMHVACMDRARYVAFLRKNFLTVDDLKGAHRDARAAAVRDLRPFLLYMQEAYPGRHMDLERATHPGVALLAQLTQHPNISSVYSRVLKDSNGQALGLRETGEDFIRRVRLLMVHSQRSLTRKGGQRAALGHINYTTLHASLPPHVQAVLSAADMETRGGWVEFVRCSPVLGWLAAARSESDLRQLQRLEAQERELAQQRAALQAAQEEDALDLVQEPGAEDGFGGGIGEEDYYAQWGLQLPTWTPPAAAPAPAVTQEQLLAAATADPQFLARLLAAATASAGHK